jgi:hypothetical protein
MIHQAVEFAVVFQECFGSVKKAAAPAQCDDRSLTTTLPGKMTDPLLFDFAGLAIGAASRHTPPETP